MKASQAEQWTVLAGKMLLLAVWLAYRALLLAARGAALVATWVLPTPATMTGAAGQGAAIVGASAVIGGLVGLAAGWGGVLVGAGIGGIIGLLAGLAIAVRGQAYVRASRGGVQLGHARGLLGVRQPHVVPRAARVRHMAVFGATGSGKSTLLKNLISQDAAAPIQPGLLCLDIKDDLVTSIAASIPSYRLGDVLLFDPTDTEFPPAFNPLANVPPSQRTLAAGELVSALHRLFGDGWGPRLEYVLRFCLLTLLETPDATLLDISRLLTNAQYRAWALTHVTNFTVTDFWRNEFPSIVGKGGSLANVQPILNKLGVFAYPEVRNVLGQTRKGLDIDAAMDNGQIVLVNLPQGVLGEDAAFFLASLLVGRVQLAAQRRVKLPPEQRHTFYAFADEFQNYQTSAFDKLITEGRSMAVGVVAACQFREQLPQQLRLVLEKNCAYGILCRQVQGRHLVNVVRWQEQDAPDAIRLLQAIAPPGGLVAGQLDLIRSRSRALLAQPRAVVERDIATRFGHRQPSGMVAHTVTVTQQTVIAPTQPLPAANSPNGVAPIPQVKRKKILGNPPNP